MTPIEKMKAAVARATELIAAGAMFTDEDAKMLNQSIEWFAEYRNQAICFDSLRGMPHKQLAEIWNVSESRISQIVSCGKPVQTHVVKVVDYPNLMRPDTYLPAGDIEWLRKQLSSSADEFITVPPDLPALSGKPLNFQCVWSIGDEVSGYEWTHKHPGNDAHATGAIESWTPQQLAERLNELESLRKPMVASGADQSGRISAKVPQDSREPRYVPVEKFRDTPKHVGRKPAPLELKKLGERFKKLRKEAGMNQAEAGEIIGETQTLVSSLERGLLQSKRYTVNYYKTALENFEANLKSLSHIV